MLICAIGLKFTEILITMFHNFVCNFQVELGDQIIFESMKSAGNYVHVTCDSSSNNDICEVNCGIDKSVFTVIRHFSPAESIDNIKPILRVSDGQVEAPLGL